MELEPADSAEFLGFVIEHIQGTNSYKLIQPWKIRNACSAGSLRLRLSGLKSRAHLIRRDSFPRAEVSGKIEELIEYCTLPKQMFLKL